MKMSLWSLACRQSVFQWYAVKNIYHSLPTRWRRKPAGTEITSLSPYASVVRPVVNNFVQKKSYFYKLWLFMIIFGATLIIIGLFLNPEIPGFRIENAVGMPDCNPYSWLAEIDSVPVGPCSVNFNRRLTNPSSNTPIGCRMSRDLPLWRRQWDWVNWRLMLTVLGATRPWE